MLQSPDVLMYAVGGLVALAGLSVRGFKAKFADEIFVKLDKKLEDRDAIRAGHDEAVAAKIETLQADMTEVKADVRDIAKEIRALAGRNGFAKGSASIVAAVAAKQDD